MQTRSFVILIAVTLIAAVIFMKLGDSEFESHVDSAFLEDQIKNIGEIALVSHKYTVPEVSFEDTWYLSTKRLILAYQGEIKFGFDTDEIRVEVDDDNERIDVFIPRARVISHEVAPQNIRILHEENGWWNNIKPDDTIRAVNKRKEELVKAEMAVYSAQAAYEFKEMISSIVHKYTSYQVRFISGVTTTPEIPLNQEML